MSRPSGPMRIQHHVTKERITLFRCLEKHFQLDREQSQRLVELGAIYHQNKRIYKDEVLPEGAYLRLHLQPKRYAVDAQPWKDLIVAKTPDFIVVNKPAGIPVHATVDNVLENVLSAMRRSTGLELYVTQRLDVAVSGLLVFARTPEFQRWFNQGLAERYIKKSYRALVPRELPVGTVVHFMAPGDRSPRVLSAEAKPGWFRCELAVEHWREQQLAGQHFYEVKINLITGRTHQIRAQLAALDSPIAGDELYGSAIKPFGHHIALAANEVSWTGEDGTAHCFSQEPWWSSSRYNARDEIAQGEKFREAES